MSKLIMETTNLQKFKELLKKSDLSQSEQDELLILFARAADEELEPMLKLLSEQPKWLKKISDNYKIKQAAITAKNPASWQKVIQDEERELQELESN